ncbi:hypothetical protein CRG98_026122 [Punica granatum]|uniref:Uncharacterized protein n=1 Tax=Punica granatum TaxID=22663 RepID=A0A2I0JB07_PUNGR|nr:hypothetical protein CRG98_026122 [Punica granatum]
MGAWQQSPDRFDFSPLHRPQSSVALQPQPNPHSPAPTLSLFPGLSCDRMGLAIFFLKKKGSQGAHDIGKIDLAQASATPKLEDVKAISEILDIARSRNNMLLYLYNTNIDSLVSFMLEPGGEKFQVSSRKAVKIENPPFISSNEKTPKKSTKKATAINAPDLPYKRRKLRSYDDEDSEHSQEETSSGVGDD